MILYHHVTCKFKKVHKCFKNATRDMLLDFGKRINLYDLNQNKG